MNAPTEKELAFLQWLRNNGAEIDKLAWPAVDPATGSRGAMALENIESGDVVLEIPSRLMMTPVDAFSDPLIGSILMMHRDLLRGDLLIVVYIMHERRKREDSFYFPYLDILPSLNNLSEWADHELLLLQDDKLIAKAESTKKMLKISYAKCILKLCDMYPVELPHEEFNFDNFVFSWYTIQARAFGRRLPWTALVPFADCLNHKNVQTKYDFIPNEATYEKQFRLLVTGTNRYAKGSEAFNSYGRRPNDNLLLEYGFAMMDNEWDELPLTLSLSNAYGLFTDKVALVCAMRRVITKTYYVHLRELNTEALHFLRLCACDTPEELEIFKANGWGHDEEHKVVSLSNEIRALGLFADAVCTLLHETLNAQTNLDSDMQLLANTNTNEVAAGRINTGADENIEREKIQFFYDNRLRPALTYRITRKKLATEMIRRVRVLIEILSSIQSVSAKGDDGTLARIPISDVDAALLENIGTLLVSEVGSITEADTSNVFIFTPVIESDQGKEFFSHYLRTVIVSFVDFGDMLCESVAVPY